MKKAFQDMDHFDEKMVKIEILKDTVVINTEIYL